MPEFIYQLSSTQLFIFLNSILFLTSFIGVYLVRRHVPVDFRYEENTAIISCSALLGMIYAILAGFTIMYELNSFDKAERAENLEGTTLFTIYHNSQLLPEPDASKIQAFVLAYAKNAVENEWPAMNVGQKVGSNGIKLLENIAHDIREIHFAASDDKIVNVIKNIAQDTNMLFKLHRERTIKVYTTLGKQIWFVLVLGTFLTLGINYILGIEFRLHVFCISLISVVIASVFYLIIGLDRPYQGDFIVPPATIQALFDNEHGVK